ncbi:hypothetical protein ACOBQX_24315 [Actinokineospora sp. G85]|uniref:hypothetical protein n=1 Tax=Actinokineospora sp. G85 TaxID=3406626 RepID=UPI003C706B7B
MASRRTRTLSAVRPTVVAPGSAVSPALSSSPWSPAPVRRDPDRVAAALAGATWVGAAPLPVDGVAAWLGKVAPGWGRRVAVGVATGRSRGRTADGGLPRVGGPRGCGLGVGRLWWLGVVSLWSALTGVGRGPGAPRAVRVRRGGLVVPIGGRRARGAASRGAAERQAA